MPVQISEPATKAKEDAEMAAETEQDAHWTVIAEDSVVQFTGRQTGANFTGHFERFDADIIFDPKDLESASVTARIDLASADAGSRERNDALPGKTWFFVKSFPEAIFMSEDFVMTEAGRYDAKGTLEIRGVTQPVTLPFTLDITDGRADMRATLSLDRSDFGVGQGEWASDQWIGFAVKVDIKIAATR